MFIKIDQDAAPGYYPNGRIASANDPRSGVSAVKLKSQIVKAADCGPGGGGLGGPSSGAPLGGGFGGAGLDNSGLGGFSPAGGMGPGGMGGGGAFSAAGVDRYNSVRDRLDEGTVAEDWLPIDAAGLDKMFMLLYHRDISGTVVDLMADTMWGEMDLAGIKDRSILKIYQDTMGTCDFLSLAPLLTRQFMVLGRFVGSMIFDRQRGIFKDIAGHDPDFLKLTPIPIRGFDPKVDLIPSPGLRAFMWSEDPRDIDARKMFPDAYVEAVRNLAGASPSGGNFMGGFGAASMGRQANASSAMGLPLDPINTLFVARKVFPHDYIGTSLFTRLITFWALEKALVNSTLTSARRRIRSIAHVTCGIDNLWEPSPAELDNIAGMFIQADDDPSGAVVATRTGVSVNEVRAGTDFYKWSDEWTLLNEGKLRVLGVSDALLSGDATYSNQEAAKTFFLERVDNLRSHLTQAIFYRRMFPLLARIHGFRKRSEAELNNRVRTSDSKTLDPSQGDTFTQRDALAIPDSELITPTIIHRKELVLKLDEKRLEIFDRAKDQGIPVPLKVWAAAANIDIDSWMAELEADADLRRQIQVWQASSGDIVDSAEKEAKLQFINQLRSLGRQKAQASLDSKQREVSRGVDEYLFWGPNFSFGGVVTLGDLTNFLAGIRNRPSTLLRPKDLVRSLHQHFESPVKASVAHYILNRCSLTPTRPEMPTEVVELVVQQLETATAAHKDEPDFYQLERVRAKELKHLTSLLPRKTQDNQQQVDSVKKLITKAAALARTDPIPTASRNVYSGV